MNITHLDTVLDLDFGVGLSVGSVDDMRARLKALLPAGWFPEASDFTGESNTPILDAVLTGPATVLSVAYYLIAYARRQTRIASASDGWLDLISKDFFNYALLRMQNETDASFKFRIIREFLRERNTRRAITTLMTEITGRAPTIVEPWNPVDCGAWDQDNVAGYAQALAYDAGGAWGEDPWTVYTYGPSAGAGYGVQPMVYQLCVTIYRPLDGRTYNDAMVIAGIERIRTAGVTIWYRIMNADATITDTSGATIYDNLGQPLKQVA